MEVSLGLILQWVPTAEGNHQDFKPQFINSGSNSFSNEGLQMRIRTDHSYHHLDGATNLTYENDNKCN